MLLPGTPTRRSKSFKIEDVLTNREAEGSLEYIGGEWVEVTGSGKPGKLLLWFVGLLAATLSGYVLEYSQDGNGRSMWIQHLFSEYTPPHVQYNHLLQSSRSSLTAVCNAVAVAQMLNATLVIPHFKESNVWKDPSKFGDIYDTIHFMSYLKEDIKIVTNLPVEYEWSTPEYYDDQCLERLNCLTFLPKHATREWYMDNVLPILHSHGVAALDEFTHKLSFEDLPPGIVELRCRTNFYALKFVSPIMELAQVLQNRLRNKAKLFRGTIPNACSRTAPNVLPNNNALMKQSEICAKLVQESQELEGSFVGLHVRFEKDMIAHSACYYDGGQAETKALAAYRRKIFKKPVKKAQYTPDFLRINGSCPLTPEEIGIFLSGLGLRNNTLLYIAGKDLYGGEARLQPLRQLFPLLENKETMATEEELKPFLPHPHQLAALDFLVLFNSNVFMSNAAGNFPNVLSGRRTFYGPRISIHPDKALLAQLFRNKSLSWPEFSHNVAAAHQFRLGAPVPRKKKFSVFRYPAPDCMCQTVQ